MQARICLRVSLTVAVLLLAISTAAMLLTTASAAPLRVVQGPRTPDGDIDDYPTLVSPSSASLTCTVTSLSTDGSGTSLRTRDVTLVRSAGGRCAIDSLRLCS